MVIGSLDHKFFMCHLPPPLKSVSRELTTSWNKNLSMNLWHRVSKWIIFPANRVSMLKMSEQRTECAGFSCMESTEHLRSEAAHVYINLSRREELWHDISPGSPTAGEGGHWRPIARIKLTSLWPNSSLHLSSIFKSDFGKSSTVNIHFCTDQGFKDLFRIFMKDTCHTILYYTTLYYN